MSAAPSVAAPYTVEIGLHGVPFTEEIVHYARRWCQRCEDRLGQRLRWTVSIERSAVPGAVRVRVQAHDGQVLMRTAEGTDLDEMLAVRNAFAWLDETPAASELN